MMDNYSILYNELCELLEMLNNNDLEVNKRNELNDRKHELENKLFALEKAWLYDEI